MTLSWTFRAHSEIGLVRKNNQDSGFVGRHLLLVADGMGGAAAGDLASAVAVDSIKSVDDAVAAGPGAGDGPDDGTDAHVEQTLLTTAIAAANNRIAELVDADFTLEGMGTTITGGLITGDRLTLAHLGDSRAYLFRDGRLERLTHDHSWVQSLIDDGKISEEEATVHPHRSLLLKVLNGHPANEADLTELELHAGDRLLFCSDGLCGFVDDDVLAEELALVELDDAMAAMVDSAHQAGGPDNITIILAEIATGDAAGPADPSGPAETQAETQAEPPVAVPQTLGAAAEREIPDLDTMVRHRPFADDDLDADPDDDAAAGAESRAVAEDEDRYAPQRPTRRRIVRPLIGVLVVVLALAAVAGVGYSWSRTQYFVGAEQGQVAIFRGVSGTPSALGLSELYEVQPLPVASLPGVYQAMVSADIDVADLAAARATVTQLQDAAERCAGRRPGSSTTPKASTSPSPSSTTGTAARTGSPSPNPRTTVTRSTTARSTPGTTPGTTAKSTAALTPSGSPTSTVAGALPPTGGQGC